MKLREDVVRVPAPDGPIRAIMISPVDDDPRQGVVFYTDIFQLTESTLRTARRLASSDEAEMHLLAVLPEHRGKGVGQRLVEAAKAAAKQAGYRRMVLWTQPSMEAAQKLYLRSGFIRNPDRDWTREGRSFYVFEAQL